jgi:hypothetical protein
MLTESTMLMESIMLTEYGSSEKSKWNAGPGAHDARVRKGRGI